MHFYQTTATETLNRLNSRQTGLSNGEVTSRKLEYGPNTIIVPRSAWWQTLIEPFRDVFVLVLAAAAAISVWHGETLDGIIISVIIVVSAIIFYIQKFSAERVLRSLNRQTINQATVTREGQIIKVASSDLVPGDIVHISEGEKIPADLRVLQSVNLRIDESVLTGESLPVSKKTAKLVSIKPIYEQSNMLFSGSFVISGVGTGVVVATGNKTESGTTASLSQMTETKSPVQIKVDKLISKIVLIVLALSIVTFGLALFRGMEVADSLRFVIALSVSAVPEGLPIAITVALVLGMRRMAGKRTLVNQLRAIETLGVITTIATDKTGTLTKNYLTVHETWSISKPKNLSTAISHVFNHSSAATDPLDRALMEYSRKHGLLSEHRQPAHEIPFEQSTALSATVWHQGDTYRIYLKGAPENILKHSSLSATALQAAEKSLAKLTKKGYRVLAVATTDRIVAPKNSSDILSEPIALLGFVAVADTIRPEAPAALQSMLDAGVTVRIITGDHAETAYQIGKELGIVSRRNEVLDCSKLDTLTDEQIASSIDHTRIFARVVPEQKFRILTILKQNNITAMTGDGVNDVPALTNAHIGIAMNSGSSIAKDAGDIILLDDNFKTIVDAMREGRAIIANIRRMLFYLISTNAGEVLTILGSLIIGIRLPLEAIQILWVNLVTDTTMVIPLGLEPAEKGIMKQKPLHPNAPIMNRVMIARTIIIALTIAILTLMAYLLFINHYGHSYAQTTAFIILVASQWGSALAARSDTESVFARGRAVNRSFHIGLLISIALQAIILLTPIGGALHIAQIDITHLLALLSIGFVVPVAVSEIHKLTTRRAQA